LDQKLFAEWVMFNLERISEFDFYAISTLSINMPKLAMALYAKMDGTVLSGARRIHQRPQRQDLDRRRRIADA